MSLTSKVIDISSTEYQVSVGRHGEDSVFKLNGQHIITAQAGGDGSYNNNGYGGDGYSGGGGSGKK